jgi:hypothetical protein
MEVDSSGSMKPAARPMATTLRFQKRLRLPVTKADQPRLGQRLAVQVVIRTDAASSVLMKRLQNTWPLPMRLCSGMRHCQPAECAVARV